MAWVFRGLRDGVVTTRYPKRSDGYGQGFRGVVTVKSPERADDADHAGGVDEMFAALCPTGAIGTGADPAGDPVVELDRGRCILCGRCVDARPDVFEFSPSVDNAAVGRSGLVAPSGVEDSAALEQLRGELARRVRSLRRSVHVRHVDAGSDGAEEWEVAALTNPVYDVQRLGIFFTASPRHADVLLVTGVGSAGMAGPLRKTFDAMPEPRVVVAAGADAISGGLVYPTYAAGPGVGSIVPVDVWVPGSPPSPFSLLQGILLGVGILRGPGGCS